MKSSQNLFRFASFVGYTDTSVCESRIEEGKSHLTCVARCTRLSCTFNRTVFASLRFKESESKFLKRFPSPPKSGRSGVLCPGGLEILPPSDGGEMKKGGFTVTSPKDEEQREKDGLHA